MRGLGDYEKADSKFRKLNTFLSERTDWDIFFAQEHKLNRSKIEDARRMYLSGGSTFWTEADGTKGGVAITVRFGRGLQVLRRGQDVQGRFLWLHVAKGDETFGVCNVHAPCNVREGKELWVRIQGQLDPALKWILGGDLKFMEEMTDKFGGLLPELKHVSMEWHDLRDFQLMLCDPWTVMLAQRKRGSLRFSWTNERDNRVELIGCRLDRIYIPMAWADRVVEYGLLPGTALVDHVPAFLTLDLSTKATLGNSSYVVRRINESLLKEEGVLEAIKNIWTA